MKKEKPQTIHIDKLACGNCKLLPKDQSCPINQHKRELTEPSCSHIHKNYKDNGYIVEY